MLFDFVKKRAQEGVEQTQNLVTAAQTGRLDEALKETSAYVKDRRVVQSACCLASLMRVGVCSGLVYCCWLAADVAPTAAEAEALQLATRKQSEMLNGRKHDSKNSQNVREPAAVQSQGPRLRSRGAGIERCRHRVCARKDTSGV